MRHALHKRSERANNLANALARARIAWRSALRAINVQPIDRGPSHLSALQKIFRSTIKNNDPGRTRTCNPRLRRPMPYPLGHGASDTMSLKGCNEPRAATRAARQCACKCTSPWQVLVAAKERAEETPSSVFQLLVSQPAPHGQVPFYIEASRGFEPHLLDSESRVLTVTPRGQLKLRASLQQCRGTQRAGPAAIQAQRRPRAPEMRARQNRWRGRAGYMQCMDILVHTRAQPL